MYKKVENTASETKKKEINEWILSPLGLIKRIRKGNEETIFGEITLVFYAMLHE